MSGKTYFERRSVHNALATYLTNAGWLNINFREGFMSEETIKIPTVTIEIVRPVKGSLEMGQSGNKVFKRPIQFDCYMESEARAMNITDDIMDFVELTPVQILNNESTNLGSLICYDNESISSDVLSPRLVDPKLLRWRGIVKSTWEAFYPE